MSTKFYNAYILKNKSSLEEIVSFNKDLIKKIQSKQKELYGTLIMGILAEAHDRNKAKLKLSKFQKSIIKNKKNPIRTVVDYIESTALEIQKTGTRNPAFDFDCELVYLPHKNDTIIKIFTEQKEFLDIIKAGLEDFSFWNNTDQPDDISEDEWQARSNFVDSLTEYSLSDNGLSAKLSKDLRFLPFYREDFKQLLSYQKPLDVRSLYIAKELDLKDFDLTNHDEIIEIMDKHSGSTWPLLEKLGDYRSSDKSKENIQKHLKLLKLKKTFTEKDLIND